MRPWLPFALLLTACAPDDAVDAASALADEAPPPVAGAPDLHVPYVVRGQTVVAVVDEVPPGSVVHLAAGLRLGRGPCLPGFGGICLGITGPRLLSTGIAGNDGVARIPFTAPINLPYDFTAFQAIANVGGTWMASQALRRPVLDDFPPGVLIQVPVPSTFDAWTADAVAVEGNALFVDVSYGGGCEPHDFAVTWDGSFQESFPVQIPLSLWHDDHDDPCDAWLSERLVFDLGTIIPRWPYGEPETAQVNLPGGGGLWNF